MIIAQVCLRLAKIKGHSKICSFTVSGRSENQSVSGVTTICLMQCSTSPSHRVDQVVDCGLWNVGPLLFNGCVKLMDIGRNRNTLSYTQIQSIPNMLNGWHVRWVCWSCKNWDVFSFQELCTDTCNMGPCIIMLQHEVMVYNFVQYRYTTRFINRQEISVYSTMKAYYCTNLTVSAICFIINCAHLLYAQNSQNVPHLKHKLNIIKDRKWHNNVSVSIHSRFNCHLLHSV